METTKKLLSFRFSQDFFLSRLNAKKLSEAEKEVSTGTHDTCPACGASQGMLIAEVDRVGFPCDTVICNNCDLVFNNTFIKDSFNYYENNFGKERWKDPEKNFLKRTAPNAFSWKRLAWVASGLGSNFKSVKNVLEIGCGDGCNLYPYHLMGIGVKGYDYDEEFLKIGRRKGINLINGDFFEDEGKYDLILLVHSYEHMLNLENVVRKTNSLLKKDGWVYIEVPGIRNWNREQKNSIQVDGYVSSNNFLSYLQYQHNYHFDLNHLCFFWERNGFSKFLGDEWVRCLFQKGEPQFKQSLEQKIGNYLNKIEKDFLKPHNLILNGSRKIFRWF